MYRDWFIWDESGTPSILLVLGEHIPTINSLSSNRSLHFSSLHVHLWLQHTWQKVWCRSSWWGESHVEMLAATLLAESDLSIRFRSHIPLLCNAVLNKYFCLWSMLWKWTIVNHFYKHTLMTNDGRWTIEQLYLLYTDTFVDCVISHSLVLWKYCTYDLHINICILIKWICNKI